MRQWNDCFFLEGEQQIRDHFEEALDTVLIMGKGFDPRSTRALELFKDLKTNLTVFMIDYNDRTLHESPRNESRSEENYKNTKELCKDMTLEELTIPQYAGDNRKKVLVISESVRKTITSKAIARYKRLVVDVSAMPRSVGFSIIKRILDIKSAEQKIYIFVCENSDCDDKIKPVIVEESAQYLPGFNTFSMSMDADDADTIWLPILGMNETTAFEIIVNYLKPVEICPIVPFPASDIRRGENILRCYGERLFRINGIEKRNIIYVPEKYPILVYHKLCETVHYYEKALNMNGDRSLKFAFSSQSSKLIDIGILLATIDLTEQDIKTGIVVVENQGYVLNEEYNKDNEQIYCLCLDESEFGW